MAKKKPQADHQHAVAHWPHTNSGRGYGVCECGATVAVDHGVIAGAWHACERCVLGAPPVARRAGW